MPKTHTPGGAPLAAISVPGAAPTRHRTGRLSPAAFAAFVRAGRPPMAGPRNRAGQRPEASRSVSASHAAGAAPAGSGLPRLRPPLSCSTTRTPHDDAPGRARRVQFICIEGKVEKIRPPQSAPVDNGDKRKQRQPAKLALAARTGKARRCALCPQAGAGERVIASIMAAVARRRLPKLHPDPGLATPNHNA
jgi:hypothetical protein